MVHLIIQRVKNWLNTKRLNKTIGNTIVISKKEYRRLLNHECTLMKIRSIVYGKKYK